MPALSPALTPPPSPAPSWKGARYGLPASGPGSLASPGRRLGARCIDWLLSGVVLAVLITLAVSLTHAFAGPFITPSNAALRMHPLRTGFYWQHFAVGLALITTALLSILYNTIATARWGRTLGKALLHIRPTTLDSRSLGAGRALGRALARWLFAAFWILGVITDVLWCLWDQDHQCLHTKMASTVVLNDPVPSYLPTLDLRASPTAPTRTPFALPDRW
jgi:uncharacterized RDD family membrane protein YckC